MQSKRVRGFWTLVALALALAGCGGSSTSSQSLASSPASTSATSPTSSASSTAPAATTSSKPAAAASANAGPMAISSPAIRTAGEKFEPIPSRYTCDGTNVSPPLHWRNVPAGTQEIALFAVSVTAHGFQHDWGMVGVKPTRSGLAAGEVPAGAILGRNSAGKVGYSTCPPKGKTISQGIFMLALPHAIAVARGADDAKLMTRLGKTAKAEALLRFSYKRA